MRELFPGYYPSNVGDVDLGADGTIVVFDANVLLNLYRYPADAAEDLLRMIEALGDRAWLPHQTALEYHRNRLTVIAEQNKRFREVRNIVKKGLTSVEAELEKLQLRKRHSTIDPSQLLVQMQAVAEKFNQDLQRQEEAHLDVTDDDPIRDRLNSVFSGRVGVPPPQQEWIAELEEEGKHRYEAKIPPGYRDTAKEGQAFIHRGLEYRREYGDLILWKQIIEHCERSHLRQVVFVTDDDKEDWWLSVDSGGRKRIGPRTELIDEITRETDVVLFSMFSSERFAQNFAEVLKIELHQTTVEQVRDVKSTLAEPVSVECPSCNAKGTESLGGVPGSSAVHFCVCGNRFHVHRGGDGRVFAKEWGSHMPSLGTHRVEATCPACNATVPANIRDDQRETERYCMDCCTLLHINSRGDVLSSTPSKPISADSKSIEGPYTYLGCAKCPGRPRTRTIWQNDNVVRAVCKDCGRLLEAQANDDV
jgi:hypothetical protein